jgi:Rieske Fe-S protein
VTFFTSTNRTRRKFLFAALGSVVSLVTGYFTFRRTWVTIGPLSSIPSDGFSSFLNDSDPIFLGRMLTGEVIALSQKCSHQGCTVAWDATAMQFKCPCHAGVFDAMGRVLSGQPVRPLERFDTRLQGDDLQVLI